MRILQSYRFLMGTKIPFDKWPQIIEQYLSQQALTHRYFHYCLETFDDSERCRAIMDGSKCAVCLRSNSFCEQCKQEAANTLKKGSACQRAAKENPFLGEITVCHTDYTTIHSLNNSADTSNDAKDHIYSILPKIYRRYGFAETYLIYRDIDFFSRRVPTPAPEMTHFFDSNAGSGITLHRSCLSQDNDITLVVESRYPGDVPDATPYADALGQLLPGIKRLSATRIIPNPEEQAYYDGLHRQAEPLIARAKDFFLERMPEEKGNDAPPANVSVAAWLKKLGKRYGYTYSGYHYYIYFMEKKLPSGHYICLEFVSNPMNPDADPCVSLCGLGFQHEIWRDGFSPQNATDISKYFDRLFATLAEAEKTVFPDILALYPSTPDWFLPTH